MDIQSYLNRFNFSKTLPISKELLYELQKAHLLNVPFENLDIHSSRKISLDIDDIYQKVVVARRGGFCYELNALFNILLKEIGFVTKLVSARVHIEKGEYSPEYDHLAIIVTIENQEYLVDVGFGKFSLEPLKLDTNIKIDDSFGQFRFDNYGSDFFRINEVNDNDLAPIYIFKNEGRNLSEFEARCEFHQTSEDSHFTQKKVISMARKNGRITLNNTQLKISESGVEEKIEFQEEEFEDKLLEYFDIKL